MNTLFPIFLKLEELNTLVVGGGNVGLEKLEAIFRNSPKATVTLVSPEIRDEIKALVPHHNLTLVFEKYHISFSPSFFFSNHQSYQIQNLYKTFLIKIHQERKV
jgi:precorrin-2 dehydrogenase/sirohydrochlorin ferrochelatase